MNTNEELKPDQPGYKYAQLKKEPTKQDVIDYLKLKTRPDFEKLAIAACGETDLSMRLSVTMGVSRWPKVREVQRAMENLWTTHVEPLQAENVKLKGELKNSSKASILASYQKAKLLNDVFSKENQNLRDLLKDAHETLIIASLIDKSNTCRDSAARIDAFLKTKTNP